MTLSVKTRFEVFKRDRFTCQYCGKHPPDVLLEADHIVPRAAGGSDEMENLTTACSDCNRGKGARLLEEGTAPAVNASAIAEMQERIEQAKAYMETLGALETVTAQQVTRVIDAWARAFNAEVEERDDGTFYVFKGRGYDYGGRWPDERSIKRFIKKLGLEPVLDAVDITATRFGFSYEDACRYFYGICHRSIREGREPLSEQSAGGTISPEWLKAIAEVGAEDERERLGRIIKRWAEQGYSSLEDAVLALWPED